MPEYRRMVAPGGTFFFTLVTFERRPLFSRPTAVGLLRATMEGVRQERPFVVQGAIVLPDHLHLLCELPAGDTNFSTRLGLIKARFTHAWRAQVGDETVDGTSRLRHREGAIWQRRFWEHTIRDERDFAAHMDYIHYNPVKHGLAACPHGWPYSSFQRWVREGVCAEDWYCACKGPVSVPRVFDRIARTVGE